jgi:hypothetical protein
MQFSGYSVEIHIFLSSITISFILSSPSPIIDESLTTLERICLHHGECVLKTNILGYLISWVILILIFDAYR